MSLLRRLGLWLRALVRPALVRREIDEELAYHVAREVERNVANGATLDEARAAARRAVGNPAVHIEQAHDAVGARVAERLAQDLRYALRTLRQAPAYTAVVVISLGLGIGAGTAMFSVADGLLLKRLSVDAPDQLVTVEQRLADGTRRANFALSDYERFRDRKDILAGMSATTWTDGFNVSASAPGPGAGTEDRQNHISIVTGNFFTMLGVRAAVGRLFTQQDDEGVGGHPVAVISDVYWAGRFERDPNILGRALTVNGVRFTIIGVTRAGFSGDWVGWPTDFWVPVAMLPDVMLGTTRAQRGGFAQFKLLGRLAPGVTVARAQSALAVVHRDIAASRTRGSGVDEHARLEVLPAARGYSSQREAFATPVILLLVLAGAVLLTVCGNVANLSLARASLRRREIAVRLAIGASRARIVRQLLTESVVVAALGCALGVLLAGVGMTVLERVIESGPVTSVTSGTTRVALDLGLDPRVLAFAIGVSSFTVLLFGLAPAIQGSRVSLTTVMNARGTARSAAGMTMRKALVAFQIALSVVLLVAGSMFVRTLRNLRNENIGARDRAHIVMAWTLPGQIGARGDALRTLVSSVHERLSRVTGVASLTESGTGLLTGSSGGPHVWPAAGLTGDGVAVDGSMTVGPSFFSTVGQRVIAGREFDARDTDTAAKVVVVNASLARRLFGTTAVLGRRIATSAQSGDPTYEIVGVVDDARYRSPRFAAGLMTYWPILNSGRAPRITYIARTNGDLATTMAAMRRAIHDAAPTLPLLAVNTADEQLDRLLFQERLVADFASFFAALALVLAGVGVFGIVAYTTARRTSEIAIRLALGAQRVNVVSMVLAESVRLVAFGALAGIPLIVALGRVATRLTYGIPPIDVAAILVAIGVLLGMALAASLAPAARAAAVDPMRTLRSE